MEMVDSKSKVTEARNKYHFENKDLLTHRHNNNMLYIMPVQIGRSSVRHSWLIYQI